MTEFNLIIKNIKGNLNKYVMYYLSNVIVVTIFFLFANFIYNPDMSKAEQGMGSTNAILSQILFLCQIVIIIFTVIFSWYSISNFLKSREKEFGLLSMFGLTKSQVRKYVMVENLIISTVSILTGLILGMLLSKLFFMAVAEILDYSSEIPFSIAKKGVIITILSFLILLNVISFIASFKIKNKNIAELFKGARIPKDNPKFSKIKAVIAILLIVSGYIIGVKSKAKIIATMIPVFIMIVIGTKYLFNQFSVYFADKLKHNKSIYYKGINMMTVSQIIYKLKDNAKVFFITSILCGVTLATAAGVYSIQQLTISSLKENCPNDIGIFEQGVNSHNVIEEGKVEEVLNKHNFKLKDSNEIKLVKVKNNDFKEDTGKEDSYGIKVNNTQFFIISQSDYNKIAKTYDKKKVDLKHGEAVRFTYDLTSWIADLNTNKSDYTGNINLNVNEGVESFNIIKNYDGGVINSDDKYENSIIVSDNDFKNLYNSSKDNDRYVYYSYDIENNLKSSDAVREIQNNVKQGFEKSFIERVTREASLMEFLSVLLFIGTFIAAIFFIAVGSILYFKIFNEIQKDKQEYIGLKKIGVTEDEIKRTVSIQSMIMFFLPFIVAVMHAGFALKSLMIFHIKYFLFIAGIYLILQTIFYLFARKMYIKQISY